jgi:cellulose biosynthesis protein BcsQ
MSIFLAGFEAAGDAGLTFTIPHSWVYGIVSAMLISLLTVSWGRLKPYVYAHFSSVKRLRRAERALDDKSPGLWLAPSIAIKPPTNYGQLIEKSKPIIVVANLKGGVGKTTTVANLIGYFGLKKEMRVLALDMDFQGSLSAVVLTEADYKSALEQQLDGSPSKSAQLIGGKDALWLKDVSDAVDTVVTARCVPSYYTLSNMENRVMVEWLIGKRKEDIRYSLARTLHDPAIQDRFDIILIDAPPRLTTACIQSLCAATHVLVPTVLDGLSAEASGGFVDQLVTNEKLWPHLRLLGVFGNMTNKLLADSAGNPLDAALADYEADARRAATDAITAALDNAAPTLRATQAEPAFPTECFIPQKAELGREAGNRIAYRSTGGSEAVKQISRAYERLGDEILRRIGAPVKAQSRITVR